MPTGYQPVTETEPLNSGKPALNLNQNVRCHFGAEPKPQQYNGTVTNQFGQHLRRVCEKTTEPF